MGNIKDFIEYILNAVKFWVIIQPWENGLRIRAGKHVKIALPGIHIRIPYIDTFYVQTIRTRIFTLPVQTLTSKDGQTVTLTGCFGYCIADMQKLYNSLYHPEGVFANMSMGVVADFIYTNNINEIRPDDIESAVLNKLQQIDYGIRIEYFKLTGFAVVKTFRLIQDHTWSPQGFSLNSRDNS